MNRDLARQRATVLGAIGQAAVAAVAGPRIAENASDEESLVEPAGYVFAIWTPIFGLSLRYAAIQGREANRERGLFRRIGWPTATAFVGATTWELVVARGWLAPAQVMIVGIAGSTNLSLLRLAAYERDQGLDRDEQGSVALLIGLLAGWTTAAATVSVSNALVGRGLVRRGGPELALDSGMLMGVGLVAAVMTRASKVRLGLASRSYAAAVLWALGGVVLKPGAGSKAVRGAALAATLPIVHALVRTR